MYTALAIQQIVMLAELAGEPRTRPD